MRRGQKEGGTRHPFAVWCWIWDRSLKIELAYNLVYSKFMSRSGSDSNSLHRKTWRVLPSTYSLLNTQLTSGIPTAQTIRILFSISDTECCSNILWNTVFHMGLLYHASQRELDRVDITGLLNLHKPPTIKLMDDLSDLKWARECQFVACSIPRVDQFFVRKGSTSLILSYCK